MRRLLCAISVIFFLGSGNYQFPLHFNILNTTQESNPFLTNPQQIESIQQLGYGSIQSMTWTDSGLYVQTSAGIWKYRDATNIRVNSFPEPLQNHYTGPIITSLFDVQNTLVVTQSDQGIVEVTNVSNGEAHSWKAHSAIIRSAAVNSTRRLLAVARSSLYPLQLSNGDDFDINVWDLMTGQKFFTLQGHTGEITTLSFSPDGNQLASAGNDATIRVWDMSNGKQIVEMQGNGPINFNTNDTLVFTRPNQIILYDLSNQQIIQSLNHQEYIGAITTQNHLLAVGDRKGNISLYNLQTGKLQTTWNAHFTRITSIQWSPNGRFFASATENDLKIWNATSSTPIADLSGFTLSVQDVKWIDSLTIVDIQSNPLIGELSTWNLNTGKQIWNTQAAFASHQIALGKEGYIWASNSNGVEMFRQDVLSDKRKFYESHGIRAIALEPSNLAIASYNWIDIVNLSSQQVVSHLEGHKESINTLAFNSDGSLLASGSGVVPFDVIPSETDHSIRLWNITSGKQVALLTKGHSPVYSLTFSPDNHWLAAGYADGTIQIWDMTDRKLHSSWTQSGAVTALAFHPNNTVLASGSQNNQINIWLVDTNRILSTLQGHLAAITSLNFDPGGQYLASSSVDGTVRLWGLIKLKP